MTLVRVKLEDGTETNVGASFANSHKLTVLEKPAMVRGRHVPIKRPVDLRGKALDSALEAAGLPKNGTADEKRQRLTDHQASVAEAAVGQGNTNIASLEGDTA